MQNSNGLYEAVETMQSVLNNNENIFIIFPGASVSKIWKAKVKVAVTLRNTIKNTGRLQILHANL